MSSVESLRVFVSERLTAAAEEIFRVFEQTIIEYEEEIARQRKLLDVVWKPEVTLHRIELPLKYVFTEEEDVPADQQLCIKESDSTLDQEDPTLPRIKEQEHEVSTDQRGEMLIVKQETDTLMSTSTYEESDGSEEQNVYLNTEGAKPAYLSVVKSSLISSGVPEPNSDHQLLSPNSYISDVQDHNREIREDFESMSKAEPTDEQHLYDVQDHNRETHEDLESMLKAEPTNEQHLYDVQDHNRETHEDLESMLKAEPTDEQHLYDVQDHNRETQEDLESMSKAEPTNEQHKTNSDINSSYPLPMSVAGKKSVTCNICGKAFPCHSKLIRHLRSHSGEKPYFCKFCSKGFRNSSAVKQHTLIHTGERKYLCNTCGKRFYRKYALITHLRIHTGEKPYFCHTCGKRFTQLSTLNGHVRRHTCVKP